MKEPDWDENWAEDPGQHAEHGWAHHGLAVLASGQLVAFHPAEPQLLVYGRDGSLQRRSRVPVSDAHGLAVVEHQGTECLWIADNGVKSRRQPDGSYYPLSSHTDGQALLVSLDGTVLQTLPKPDRDEYADGPYCPTSIAVDEVRFGGTGDIWVSDGYGQSLLHRFDSAGRHLATVRGDEPGGPGRLACPHALVLDRRRAEPELYVADRRNAKLVVYGLDGQYRRTVGVGDLVTPSALAVAGDRLVVAEHRGARLALFDGNDEFIGYVGRNDAAQERPGWPNALAEDGTLTAPPVDAGLFNSPHGVAVGADGELYVAEWLIGGRMIRLS